MASNSEILVYVISVLLTCLGAILSWIGARILMSLLELNKKVAVVIKVVSLHHERLNKLENPECEH